jgi:hypothetical protein
MNDDYDASRLPRHGQTAVAALRDEIERLNKEAERLRGRLEASAAGSDTFAEPYDDTPQPLGRGTMVRFNGADTTGDTYDVQMRDGDLYVLVNGMQGDTAIVPQSSNTIRIRKISRR